MEVLWAIAGAVAGAAILALLGWAVFGRRSLVEDLPQVINRFQHQRASLERELFRRAAASGRPRGLRWKNCDFDPQVTLARQRDDQSILAFVGVTISFEAIPGGPMEDVEAVGNLRAGTVVFTYERGQWKTDGRVLFNLDPQDALRRYEGRVEIIER